MSFIISPYVLAQAVSALISITSAVVAWRLRAGSGGRSFALLMTAVSIWTTAVTLEEGAVGLGVKTLMTKAAYLGAVNVAPLVLLFAWSFGRRRRRAGASVALLWIVPVITLGLVATNELHHLVWTTITLQPSLDTVTAYAHGPAWWVFSGYSLVVMLVASAHLGTMALGTSRTFSRQTTVVLAAICVVAAGFILDVAPGNPLPGLDLPAASFALAGAIILVGLTRTRIAALSPIAREALVEAMPDGLIAVDMAGTVVDVNPAALALLRRATSVVGSPLGAAVAGWPELAAALPTGNGRELFALARREDRFFQVAVAMLGGPTGERLGRMITLRDVTDQRRAQRSSEENEESLRLLLSAAQRQAKELELLDQVRSSLATELDLDVIFKTVVEGISRVFGYTQVSLFLLRDGVLMVQHQVGYRRIVERIPITTGITGRVARTGEPVLLEDVHADPEFIGAIEGVVSEVCVPLFDRGMPAGVLNVESTNGVTMGPQDLRLMTVLGEHVSIAFSKARLYAEARDNEERYRALVTTLGEGVAIVDLSERFVFANPAAEAVFGVPPDGLVGRGLAEFLDAEEMEDAVEQTKRRQRGESSVYLLNIRRPDGKSRRIELTATPRRDADGKVSGTLGIFRDTTDLTRAEEEKARLQEQLQQAQKMEAVGRLAGGIAHDFNNILTVITGYCEMAIEEAGANPSLKGSLEQIKRASRRSATLISQLLTFSRRQILLPRVFDLAGLVDEMEGMLRRLLGEDVRLQTAREGDSHLVNADSGRMEQVLMNLAVNARDAMPGGGQLDIRTRVVRLAPEDLVGHPEVQPGEFIGLSVSDTGLGMDAATQARLFEPFFTTKEVGKGTGLGLATIYGIVSQSRGHVTCQSEVGRGTTFTVYLPRVAVPASGVHASEDGKSKLVGGTERVLLVEDDESVRRFVRSILEAAGYTVIPADSGAAALDQLDRLPQPPDLLLSDVIMPGMDGRVLAQEVARRVPGVRVVLMSGYAEVAAGVPGLASQDPRLIQKPFSAADLLGKIRVALAK